MHDSLPKTLLRRSRAVASLAAATALLAGCASGPPAPTDALMEAKVAIEAAQKDDASRYAIAELDEARQKLVLADKAVLEKDMLIAERFADESAVTARLAMARTQAIKARAINAEMGKAAEALQEEMQRAGDTL